MKQYTKMLELDDVDLSSLKKLYQQLVKSRIEKKTGARGLRSIIEESLIDIMFDVPSQRKCNEGSYYSTNN